MDWNLVIVVGSNVVIFLTFMAIWITLYVQMRNEMSDWRKESQAETKEFHAKLIKLEERYLSKIIRE